MDTRLLMNELNRQKDIHISKCSLVGHASKTQVNNPLLHVGQDRVFSGWIEDVFVSAVFAGHGVGGSAGAEASLEMLTHALTNPHLRNRFYTDPAAAMAELFWHLHTAVIQSHDNAPCKASLADEFGVTEYELTPANRYVCTNRVYEEPFDIDFGCAACAVVIAGNSVIVGNVGDAVALLVECDDSADPIVLTQPHSVQNPVEARRLRRDFGDQVEIFDDGFWKPKILTSELNLTRSLGHKISSKFGISYDPFVSQRLIGDTTFALVLCSSGVSEWLGPVRISSTMNALIDAQAGVDQICKDAFDSGGIDDCTVSAITFCDPRHARQQNIVQHLSPIDTWSAERVPSLKQRHSNRRTPSKLSKKASTREGIIWTVKDAAWAWGLGSLHAKSPEQLNQKCVKKSPTHVIKKAVLRAQIEAEDNRLQELERKLKMMDSPTAAIPEAMPQSPQTPSKQKQSGKYGFQSFTTAI
eukprot:m.225660 g.225660  ORF g.225660 m.225660 type:complete len:470 (+) comp33466_c0_seq5:311-1720(+)